MLTRYAQGQHERVRGGVAAQRARRRESKRRVKFGARRRSPVVGSWQSRSRRRRRLSCDACEIHHTRDVFLRSGQRLVSSV